MRKLFVLLAMFMPFGLAFSQTYGEITGQVTDPSGALLQNARVALKNTATNATRDTMTNTQGIYDFPAIVPATYSVKVDVSGFAGQERTNINVEVQQSARVDFALDGFSPLRNRSALG